MVQKEVGERFAAQAGDEAYGAASLRVQYFADAQVVGKVSPKVFVPKPNVDSALVSIVRRDRVRVDPDLVSEAAAVRGHPHVLRPAAKDAAPFARRLGRPRVSSSAPTSPRRDVPRS